MSDTIQAETGARILQISDLHFGNHDSHAWNEVEKLAEKLAGDGGLDYIVVTGDLQNHFHAPVKAVKEALASLEKHCGRILIIPGNHDYRLFGLVDPRIALLLIALMAPIAVIIPFAFWPANVVGIIALFYIWFPRWYFRWNYRKWWHGPEVIFNEKKSIVMALFDSNSVRSSWARGRIGNRQLDWINRQCAVIKANKNAAFDRAVKIALMHHHPMPIVRPEKAMGFVPGQKVSEMLMLDDASEVLRSLVYAGFDVILHGHKHAAAATRLATEMYRGDCKRQMLIAACGTTCIKDEGPFSANLLTILPTGHVVLDRFFSNDPAVSGPFEPMESMVIPTRRIELDAAATGYKTRKAAFSYAIDEDGDASVVQDLIDLETTMHSPPPLGKFGVEPPCGTIHGAHFESPQLSMTVTSTTNAGIVGEFHPWSAQRGEKASGRLSYWMMGMWVLNEKDMRLVHGPAAPAWAGCYVLLKRPTDSFEISIQLPKNCRPERPRINFFTFDDLNEPVLQLGNILESGLLWSKERNFIGVKLNNPPLGVYGVIWDLPAAPTEVIADQKAHSDAKFSWESLRADLVRMDALDAPDNLKKFAIEIRTIMDSINQLLAAALGVPSSHTEKFEVSLMVYDSTTNEAKLKPALRVVAHNRYADLGVKFPRLPVGTGIAGRASKTGKALVYNEAIGLINGKPIPYFVAAGQKQHEVLYSLPIPSATDPALWTGVVLNIGAYEDCGALLPGKDEKWEGLVDKIGLQVPAIRQLISGAWTAQSEKSFKG